MLSPKMLTSFSLSKGFIDRQRINSFLRVLVAYATVVGEVDVVCGIHGRAQYVEGIVNYIRNGSSVGCVKTHANGSLEVDIHLEVDNLRGLDDLVRAGDCDVKVADLEHLILQDSEAPEVLRVLECIDLHGTVGGGRAEQILALHLTSVGLHVLDQHQPDFGARISTSLSRLGGDIEVAMYLDLADFNLATNPVVQRCAGHR